MGITSKRTLVFAAAACLILVGLNADAEDIKLQVGITGNNTLRGLDDPVTVAQMPEVSRLLQAVADEPRSAEFIGQSLRDSEADLDRLVELGLLKEWDGRYAISFNYLTVEDHDLLMTALAPFAESLAQSYRDRWPEFEASFSAYDAQGVAAGEIAYALIGAFSLDWDGLDITAEKDLRITADNLPLGREFVVWAKEKSSEINTKGLYWGSHNTVVEGVRFTTFGDHHSLPRLGFPDLLWSTSSRVAKIDDAPRSLGMSVYKALVPYYQNDFLKDAGAILRLLRQGPVTGQSVSAMAGVGQERSDALLELLQELQYVQAKDGSFSLATPYFSLADKAMTDAVRALGWQIMDDWLDNNAASVKDSLQQLNAIQFGVPYRQLFTEIWHYLFGMANRSLVESGHFADPYADERLSKGMIPFAFDAELLQLKTEVRN
jgi:hypothetical protein